jgi:hypothetical protein
MAKKDHPIKVRQSEWQATLEHVKWCERDFNWPECSPAHAARRLRLKSELQGPLNRAFKYFGLDPQNGSDQTLLLAVLAGVLFGTGKVGRKKGSQKWDTTRLWGLRRHLDGLIASHPGMNDEKAAEEIKKLPAYKDTTPGAIRRRIPAALRLRRLIPPNPHGP